MYYNYCAASGGSYCYDEDAGVDNPDGVTTLQDSKYDICPKGWRLPTGSSSGDFYNLYNEFSGSTDQEVDFQTSLNLPLSGDFYSGKAFNQGLYGYWWTSTYGSAEDMYYFIVSSAGSEPWNHDVRFLGLSIRCILDTSN